MSVLSQCLETSIAYAVLFLAQEVDLPIKAFVLPQSNRRMVDDYKNVTLDCGAAIAFNDITNEEVFCTNVAGLVVEYVLPIILVN